VLVVEFELEDSEDVFAIIEIETSTSELEVPSALLSNAVRERTTVVFA